MKKLVSAILMILIVATGLCAYACHRSPKSQSDFEIIPTMDTESNAKNVVWVGTFQLVWNDLISELVKSPVKFMGSQPSMADALNKQSFDVSDLNESSYYKKFGNATYEVKKEIETAIKEKFNEKSDILDSFSWKEHTNEYVLYAMLKKDFEYVKTLDKLEDDVFNGSKSTVKYFGIDRNSDRSLRYTIGVLFYNDANDFAVSLRSKQGDTVYFYRTDDKKTLNKLYDDMIQKSYKYMGLRSFGNKDQLKIPMLDFKNERNFEELCNKPIKNTDFIINKAIETIQFKMDEKGVKLKSEAGMIVGATAIPSDRDKPRHFFFNDRYVIFLQEKSKPYFAMKIEDVKPLQKK